LVEAHYPVFVAQLATRGTPLPEYVQQEFTDYLRCGRLEHGFLRVRCESCYGEYLVALVCNSNYTSCVLTVMFVLMSYK
jgi:hypothetical protein